MKLKFFKTNFENKQKRANLIFNSKIFVCLGLFYSLGQSNQISSVCPFVLSSDQIKFLQILSVLHVRFPFYQIPNQEDGNLVAALKISPNPYLKQRIIDFDFRARKIDDFLWLKGCFDPLYITWWPEVVFIKNVHAGELLFIISHCIYEIQLEIGQVFNFALEQDCLMFEYFFECFI